MTAIRRRSTRRRTALATIATLAAVGSGCTSPNEEFCGELENLYTLDDLALAIEQEDQSGINEGLDDLRRLEAAAPEAVHDDIRQINDTMIDVVRTVTGSAGPEGQTAPVDPDALRGALTDVAEPAQRVTDFADRECGLTL